MGAKFKDLQAAVRAPWLKRFGILTNVDDLDRARTNDHSELWRNAGDTADVEALRVDDQDMVQLAREVIHPMRVTKEFHLATNGSIADQVFFIADQAYKVEAIEEIHATAGDHASAVTAVVRKCADGVTIVNGTNLMASTSTFDLKGTANTKQAATLSSSYENDGTSVLELAENDRIAIDITGTVTTLAGLVVTLVLSPASRSETAVFNLNANGDLIDAEAFFIANRAMIVNGVKYAHSVAGTHASAVTLQVVKDTGTDAPGAGTDLLTNNSDAGFDCKGTINTVQEGALATAAATLRLAAGDRLSLDFAGTLTALAGVVVVVEFEPLYDRKEISYNLAKHANLVDEAFFIADRPYEVIAVSQVHATAGDDSSAVSLQATIDKATDAPGAGTDLLSNNANAGFNLKGTANTVQVGTFKDTRENFLLAGDRLSLDYAGTLDTLAGVVVTASLKPV